MLPGLIRRLVWVGAVALTLTSAVPLCSQESSGPRSTANLEVYFVYLNGTRADGRQTGPVVLENLSTHEKIPLHVDNLGHFRLENLLPGSYRLNVRQHIPPLEKSCGARPKSWKLNLKPQEWNRFTFSVHLIDGNLCVVD